MRLISQTWWKTCTLARVLTRPYRPREPWGHSPANHHMEAVPRAPNWLSTGKFASHWHIFRPTSPSLSESSLLLSGAISAEKVGSQEENAYLCPDLVQELGGCRSRIPPLHPWRFRIISCPDSSMSCLFLTSVFLTCVPKLTLSWAGSCFFTCAWEKNRLP